MAKKARKNAAALRAARAELKEEDSDGIKEAIKDKLRDIRCAERVVVELKEQLDELMDADPDPYVR